MLSDRQILSPLDLRRVNELQRSEDAFLAWRDARDSELKILVLSDRTVITIGRRSSNDLSLPGDSEASRAHARLERLGDDWLVLDDGISSNGTFVNGARITRRHRLADGDQIRFGSTVVDFHRRSGEESAVTLPPLLAPDDLALTPTQHRILIALCRPYQGRESHGTPASNREIASEVFLGVDAVKAHLRGLYRRFDIQLPPIQKRVALAQVAIKLGVADSDA